MSNVDIMCYGCGELGTVNKVTAGLRCLCGSHDLDVYTGSIEQAKAAAKIASKYQTRQRVASVSFGDWMTKQSLVSGDVPGWNEYTGPRPGVNNESNGVGTPFICPVCHGSGFDLQDGGECRECGGKGITTANANEHEEVPAVARHNYPSNQTKIPFVGQKKTKPTEPFTLFMIAAACPDCGTKRTELKKDAKHDAWWACTSCGPLVNLDRNPHINPYQAMKFKRERGFKTAKNLLTGKPTGKLITMMAAISKHNDGLTPQEIMTLGLRSIALAENK